MPKVPNLILSDVSVSSYASSEQEEEEEIDDDQSPQPGSSAVTKKRGLHLPPGYQPMTASSTGPAPLVSSLNVESAGSNDLWVIRLPAGVKPKHVAGLKLDLSSLDPTNLRDRAHKVGETRVAEVEFDIFAQQMPTSLKPSSKHAHDIAPETGEVSQFIPMLPDQKRNTQLTKLVIAPQRISKVIFFRRRFPAGAVKRTKKSTSILSSNPCGDVQFTTKRAQPKGLELRNIPSGATPIISLNPSHNTTSEVSYLPRSKKSRLQ